MKKQSSGIKKNKTDLQFENQLMEKILDGASLATIAQLVRDFYQKENWKPFLYRKVL